MNILVIGDSHAKARLPDGTDTDIIAKTLEVPEHCRLAVSGSTARQWKENKNGWLSKAVILAKSPDIDAIFVSLGGNDLFRDYADGVLTSEEAKAIVSDIIYVLKEVTYKPIFLLVYGDPDKGKDIKAKLAAIGIDLAYSWIKNAVKPVTLIREYEILTDDDWCGTDIHPNESGYIKIANKIKEYFK